MNQKEINVLMFSGDPRLANPQSAVALRLASYSVLAHKIFIVVSGKGVEYKLAENIVVFPIGRGWPFLRVKGIIKKAKEIILKNNLNPQNTIITTQDPFDTGTAGVLLKKEFNIPLELQIHGDIMSPWFSGQSFLHKIRVSRLKEVLQTADTIRVVSNTIAESISKIVDKDKIYVLPIAIKKPLDYGNRNFLSNKYLGLGFIMLTIARLEPEKNVAQAIRLLQKVLTIEPRAGLIIVGDGSQRKKLEKLSKKLGIKDHVSFEGWQEDTKDYFASAHLYLQTSFFEGYGMAIAEAALAGRAILSTDVGVAHDLAKLNSALVAPVDDDEKLFEQAKILLDQERRTIMGISAQRVIDSLIVSKEKFLQVQNNRWQLMLENIQ